MSRPSLINAVVGEYRITERIGAGGMGEVYKAVHAKIGRIAAIKFLSESAPDPQFLQRFLNEAQIQASLQHSNIVTLYDFLEYNRQPCIIMEYIEGQTLSEFIRARGCLPMPEILRIFHATTDALAYVHSRGIIHRDIKSSNIKLTPTGQVKVLDFGIAKAGGSPTLTMTGAFVGTLQYISPEQFTGGIADARSDIWALGVLLYEMVTCRMPFDAPSIGGLFQQVVGTGYTPPSALGLQVHPSVEAIINRCLRKNPAERYPSAVELLQDVNRAIYQADAPTQVTPAAVPAQPVHPAAAPSAYTAPPSSYPPPLVTQPGAASYPTSPTPHQITNSSPMPAASGVKTPLLFGGLALVLVAVLASGLYFMMRSGNSPALVNSNVTANSNRNPATRLPPVSPGSQMTTFSIEVFEGQADVYKGGQKVGTTPYKFEAKPGDRLDFTLKREGYVDESVQLMVNENKKVYTFSMEKKP